MQEYPHKCLPIRKRISVAIRSNSKLHPAARKAGTIPDNLAGNKSNRATRSYSLINVKRFVGISQIVLYLEKEYLLTLQRIHPRESWA